MEQEREGELIQEKSKKVEEEFFCFPLPACVMRGEEESDSRNNKRWTIFLIHSNPHCRDPQRITGTNKKVRDYRKMWNNRTGGVGGEGTEGK